MVKRKHTSSSDLWRTVEKGREELDQIDKSKDLGKNERWAQISKIVGGGHGKKDCLCRYKQLKAARLDTTVEDEAEDPDAEGDIQDLAALLFGEEEEPEPMQATEETGRDQLDVQPAADQPVDEAQPKKTLSEVFHLN